ncbi:MAG: alpha/beta hydrolase, partial [Flavobacteriaceae bacterium]
MKNKYVFLGILSLVLFCIVGCKQNKTEPVVETHQSDSKELRSVLINGDSIHYIDVGKGEPVVLVHGSIGDYTSWAFQVDTFATKHRVIAYSRRYATPNNQNYPDSADFSVVPHAKDLATLIKTLNLGSVHLVGHSWGAFTALKTTIDHPELVKSLTLGEPPVQSLIKNTKLGDSLLNNL